MSISTDVACLLMIGVCLQMPLVDAKLRGFFLPDLSILHRFSDLKSLNL